MTKIYNRHGFETRMRNLIKSSDPKKRMGLIYLDLDNLKVLNDTHGHKAGDKAILNISQTLLNLVRSRDLPARVGGDEFVIAVEEVSGDTSTAVGLAKRIQKSCANNKNMDYSTTVSIGVHLFEVGELLQVYEDRKKFSKALWEMVSKADELVYKSKKLGKNKVTTI